MDGGDILPGYIQRQLIHSVIGRVQLAHWRIHSFVAVDKRRNERDALP